MNITGVKNAVSAYRRAMALGARSPWYAEIMLDCATGEVWADVFYDVGRNEHKIYRSASIINLTDVMAQEQHNRANFVVNMTEVRNCAEKCCRQYSAKTCIV